MRIRFGFLAAAGLALIAPAGAQAAVFVANFNTTNVSSCVTSTGAAYTCSTSTNGTYGNGVKLAASNDSTLQVLITGWQASQTNGAISSAFLGTYSGGLGVTGLGDSSGSNNLHTMDNVGGYTDFVVLQFSRAVSLTSLSATPFAVPLPTGGTGTDTDMSVLNAQGVITPSAWNVRTDITAAASMFNSITWGTAGGTSAGGARAVSGYSSQFSSVWLVSASALSTDRNDGFKLSAISAQEQTPPVPEPATWATMILGFGAIGAAMRRRRVAALTAAA